MPSWKKLITSGSSAELANLTIPDDGVINIGTSNDLQLYHDGNHSFIKDAGTGNLNYLGGTQTFQNADANKTMATFNAASSVELRFNNVKKFETTETGINVVGNITGSSNLKVDGRIGVGVDPGIYHLNVQGDIRAVDDIYFGGNISASAANTTASFGQVVADKYVGEFSGDGSGLTGVGSSITAKDEGSNLTTAMSSIDFVGSGVTATQSSDAVTVTVAGADLDSVFETDGSDDLMPAAGTSGLSVFYEYESGTNDIQPRA